MATVSNALLCCLAVLTFSSQYVVVEGWDGTLQFFNRYFIDSYDTDNDSSMNSDEMKGMLLQLLGHTSKADGDKDHRAEGECINGTEILKLIQDDGVTPITENNFNEVCAALLYQLDNRDCLDEVIEDIADDDPSSAEAWGYSVLSISLINLTSLLGALFYPVMDKWYYARFLMFMVSLGVGTLCASGILVLIPECFDLLSEESHIGDEYQWKALTVLGGIYMFFLLERFIKFIKDTRRKSKLKERTVTIGVGNDLKPIDVKKDIETGDDEDEDVKEVAWMIVFGDGLHNFVDGLAIGAAFTDSALAGISISLAILCEELPHELGDFAILLRAGMSIKKALLMNFSSACLCYIGMVIGVLLGELADATPWIFAIAGGMFLYISLVDMLPEVNREAELEVLATGKALPSFILQNLGLLSGFGIILLLVTVVDIDLEDEEELYSDALDFTRQFDY